MRSSLAGSVDRAAMQRNGEASRDRTGEGRAGPCRIGRPDKGQNLGVQLERPASAAPLIEQPQHTTLRKGLGHQIVSWPRIAVANRRLTDAATVNYVGPQHFVLHLELISSQKERPAAVEQRRGYCGRIRVQ